MAVSRPVRIALWMGAALLGILVLLVGTVLIVPNTEGGRAYIVRKLSAVTDGKVRLVGIHGSFPAALDLDRLELRDSQGLWLWADHLSLRWSPGALLARHVNVDSLHVATLHVERSPVPDKEEKPGSSSSSIPETDLRDLSVGALELGKALAGDPTSLTIKGNAHLRSLQDVDVHIVAQRTGGNGDYEVTAHFDPRSMNATVKLQEPANGPLENLIKVPGLGALNVLVELQGPRNAEDLRLSVDAGPLQARANGRIDLVGSTADLQYSLTAPAMSPMEGLSWQRVNLQGQIHGPFTAPAADGRLVIEELEAPGGARLAALDAQVKGDQGSVALQAGIDGLQIPGPAPKLFADSRLMLDASVRLDDPQRPLQLTATHRLFVLNTKAITAGTQSADLTLRVPDLKPFAPLSGAPLRGDADLGAHVDYSPSLTQLTADLESHLDGGSAAWAGLVRGGLTRLQVAAEMTDQQFSVKDLQLTARAISLSAAARAARTGDQRINVQYNLGLPDLHRVSAALVGKLTANGSLEGPRQQLTTDTRLTTSLSVHGSPRGTVTARVQASGLPAMPEGMLEAGGELDGAPLRVNVEVQPAGSGGYHAVIHRADWKSAHIDGDVTTGKSVADARGKASLRIGQLSDFNTLAGSTLSGAINGHMALASQRGKSSAQLALEAQNVVAGGVTANARVNADGPMDALKVTIDGDSPAVAGQPARINTTTTVNLTAKELQLASLKATWHDQDLTLLNPAKIALADGLKIEQLRLGIQDARIEVDGQVSPTLDLHAAVRQIKPALVNAFLPDTLASGTIDAEADVQGTTSAPTGKIHFQALGMQAKSAVTQGLPAADLRADADLKGTTADVSAQLTAGSNSKLEVAGRAPLSAGGVADLKLAGSLDLGLANPILEAEGRHVAGTVAINTTVKGTTADPQIAGTVDLANGSVRDYTQGVSLTDITGRLSGDQGGVLKIERLTAKSAPGNINIQGTVGILQPKIPVDISVTAKDAQPVASNIVTANLDADIKVKGTAKEQMDVSGKVHLNRANISIPGGMPPDVAVLDVERDGAKPAAAPEKPVVINLHLDIDAPNRILISGRGLDAAMGGDLKVRGTTDVPVVNGGFELQRGFFTLANSKLTFTQGNVTFNGMGLQKKLDPSLDFTAQTKAAEVTAVVHITGLADAPQIELTSTPELPQDEILARLLFGEPAAQLTALQLVQTGAALASLRGGGGGSSLNPVAKIQKALGLDRLSVGGGSSASGSSASSQTSTGPSVEAGRYVSSRVYVGVKESTTGASKVDVDVDLTKRLKLQASLGNGTTTAQGVTPENDPGSSLGLAYQFEY
jgi:translocation and assembly module TamB